MRHRYVPSTKEVIAILGEIAALTEPVRREFKWIEPGLYRKDRLSTNRTSGGGPSDPTGDVATGREYERRRNAARRMMAELERAREALKTAEAYVKHANPRYEVAEPEVYYPQEISPRKNRRLQEQLAYKQKREAMGIE